MNGRIEPSAPNRHGAAFWIGFVIGLAFIAYGIRSFTLAYSDTTRRISLVRWVVGADLVHDLIVAPVTIFVGVLLRRTVPRRVLGPVQFGVYGSAIVLILAWRPLTHSGAFKHNPTVQPLDYTTATLTALAAVWGIATVWFLVRGRHRVP